jgi:hypothetical protein
MMEYISWGLPNMGVNGRQITRPKHHRTPCMRYSITCKQETCDKLLDSSCAIAKRTGFDTTGVDASVEAIGLSEGERWLG